MTINLYVLCSNMKHDYMINTLLQYFRTRDIKLF